MILNNLKNLLKNHALYDGLCKSSTSSQISGHELIAPLYSTDGTLQTKMYLSGSATGDNFNPLMNNSSWYLAKSQTNLGYNTSTIGFGNGSTPVTENDYCLESFIDSSNFSISSCSALREIELDKDNLKLTKKVTLVFNIKNKSSADINISEIGLFQLLYTTSSSDFVSLLIHREVFEAVTIPSGGVRKFQFDFEFVKQLA